MIDGSLHAFAVINAVTGQLHVIPVTGCTIGLSLKNRTKKYDIKIRGKKMYLPYQNL